jgi:shikimate kinase
VSGLDPGAPAGRPGGSAGPHTRPVCVLVGPPGAGKTTVGGLVAARLGVPFRDTDTDIERVAGKPIPEIFVDDGEPHFRALERDAVARALAGFGGVLALGGGAVMDEHTRDNLRGHTVVFLSVELPDAASRVGLGAGRPLLTINPRATMKHLLEARRPVYRQVATAVIRTDGVPAEDVADQVLRALPGRAAD